MSSIVESLGPPDPDWQTNFANPRVCPVDGKACTCSHEAKDRTMRSKRYKALDVERLERNKQHDEKLLTTQNPQDVVGIRMVRTAIGKAIECPRTSRLH